MNTNGKGETKVNVLELHGVRIELLARSSDTGGAFSLLRYTAPAGMQGPPPHIHREMTEAFLIEEGEMTFLVDGQWVTAGPGELVTVQPGTAHTFANQSATPSTFLLWLTPGGFERYFEEVVQLASSEAQWPPADPSKLAAVTARYDLEAVLPERG